MADSIDVTVTVEFTIPIDPDQHEGYPPDVIAPNGRLLGPQRRAEVMARFDAEEGDEPVDVYATDSKVIASEVRTRE